MKKTDTEVIIIGSGFSGIGAGIKLKEAGYSFLILERESDIGGTWRDNQYPGVAVDITSFTYSYSFEQNPNWSRIFAPGEELFRYANHCVDKYGIRDNFLFNSEVEQAVYDADQTTWTVTLKSGKSYTSNIVISATGALTDPKFPDIDGFESFKGKVIHTARWDHSYDLTGKRVAVIGTGATSVQLVPAIAPIVEQLYVFQRTPIWIFPKPDAAIPDIIKNVFSTLPLSQNTVRKLTDMLTQTVMVTSVVNYKQYPFLIKYLEKICLYNLKQQVKNPDIRKKLTPNYGFGCKRPSFSNDFYPTFNRQNVELVTDGISKITKDSIITKDGSAYKIDTLIAATGFNVMKNTNYLNYRLVGKNGMELGDFWSTHRLQAYQGCSVPNFPNFFIIFGPYAASGLSWFDMIEIQLTHIMRVLNEKRNRNAATFEIKQDEHDKYFKFILKQQQNTVFLNNNCASSNSYYFDKFGDAPFLRPLTVAKSKEMSCTSDLNHYSFT